MSLVLKNVNIIDATTPEVRTERNVLVKDGVIQQVTSGPAPDADRVVDLEGGYLLPGLWDVHTHLNKGTYGPESVEEESLDLVPRVLEYARNSMDALNMGVTSLRTVGVQEWADVALRDAFSAGKFKGPRLFCGGHALNTTAGHMADVDKPIDGPVAFVKAVRNEIMHYVNHIKLVTTGGIIGTGHDVMTNITWLRGEVEAALTIAKQRGVPAAVHATVPEAIKWAVSAGCRSIEHGYVMDEEAAKMMADTGTYYVPTLALSHLTPEQADSEGSAAYCQHHPLPDEFRERANFFAPVHDESFRIALDAGVKIASGSDQGPPGEAAILEVEKLSKVGLGPYGAIVAATQTSAEVCGAGDKLGTIEPGKFADFIAIETNPLENIENLRRLQLVVARGEVAVDKR